MGMRVRGSWAWMLAWVSVLQKRWLDGVECWEGQRCIRWPNIPSYHPVPVDGLQSDGPTGFATEFELLGFFLFAVLASQGAQAGASSWTFAVIKVVVIIGIIGIVDHGCPSLGRSSTGTEDLGLEDGLEKGVCILPHPRRITGDESLRRGHIGRC